LYFAVAVLASYFLNRWLVRYGHLACVSLNHLSVLHGGLTCWRRLEIIEIIEKVNHPADQLGLHMHLGYISLLQNHLACFAFLCE